MFVSECEKLKKEQISKQFTVRDVRRGGDPFKSSKAQKSKMKIRKNTLEAYAAGTASAQQVLTTLSERLVDDSCLQE